MDTKDIKKETTFEEDLEAVFVHLPQPVKTFFKEGGVERVAKNLKWKYQLSDEGGAIVTREIILLLLGLKDLGAVEQTFLDEAKLDNKTVEGITDDINEQIFTPLTSEMEGIADIVKVKENTVVTLSEKVTEKVDPSLLLLTNNIKIPGKLKTFVRKAQSLVSVPKYMLSLAMPKLSPTPTPPNGRGLASAIGDLEKSPTPTPPNGRGIPATPTPIPVPIPIKPLPTPPPKKMLVPAAPYTSDPYRESIDKI